MSTYGYEQLGLLDLSLQEDGSFGIDPSSFGSMDSAALNLNVFDDQGLGVAGMVGRDPDMQDATQPRPARVQVVEDREVLAVELTDKGKFAVVLVGGIALGLLAGTFLKGR